MTHRLPPAARLTGIGFYFATCIIGGIAGGVGLDFLVFGRVLVFFWIGLLFGFFAAGLGGYRMLMDVLQPEQGEKR